MLESDMENFELEETEDTNVLDPNIRKQLREAQKVAQEVQSSRDQLATLQKELAFAKAGIPEDGVGALLRVAYQGENTPEAVKAEAAKYGVLSNSDTQSQNNSVSDSELDSFRRVAGAATSAGGNPPVDAGQAFLAEMGDANSEKDAMAVITKFARSNPELGISPPGSF